MHITRSRLVAKKIILTFGRLQIWEGILGFEDAEFYLKEWPQLVNKPFEDVLISFPNAIPCGIKVAKDGRMVLNPNDDYIMQEGDELLVVAEEEDSYGPFSPAQVCHFCIGGGLMGEC